jgi:hypothetical protein
MLSRRRVLRSMRNDLPQSSLLKGCGLRISHDSRPWWWLARQADGVCRDQRRKARVNALISEYLKTVATWLSGMLVFSSSSHAISKRISPATLRNASPSFRKCRLMVRRCIENRRATATAEQVPRSSSFRSTRRRSVVRSRSSACRVDGISIAPFFPADCSCRPGTI